MDATYHRLRIERGWEPWLALGPRFLTEVICNLPYREFPDHYFYPVTWHGIDCDIDTKQFPNSLMIQYGYSTNGLNVD